MRIVVLLEREHLLSVCLHQATDHSGVCVELAAIGSSIPRTSYGDDVVAFQLALNKRAPGRRIRVDVELTEEALMDSKRTVGPENESAACANVNAPARIAARTASRVMGCSKKVRGMRDTLRTPETDANQASAG